MTIAIQRYFRTAVVTSSGKEPDIPDILLHESVHLRTVDQIYSVMNMLRVQYSRLQDTVWPPLATQRLADVFKGLG